MTPGWRPHRSRYCVIHVVIASSCHEPNLAWFIHKLCSVEHALHKALLMEEHCLHLDSGSTLCACLCQWFGNLLDAAWFQVVSAHAASIGDNLLGVPLNCSAGLDADAVTLLQEAGMWRHAAVLTARALSGTERAQALSHWSNHVLRHEGSVWRCVGILATAGCLSAAAQVGSHRHAQVMMWQIVQCLMLSGTATSVLVHMC